MSIAVSAVIKPSRCLLSLVGGMSIVLLLIAALVATGAVGDLFLLARIVVAGVCAIVAVAVFLRARAGRTTYVIHISGTGQIRLRTEKRNEHAYVDAAEGELVRLLPISTIWPGLLLLHLKNERQQTTVVAILTDAISAEGFRALLVACRWIVLRQVDTTESDIRH